MKKKKFTAYKQIKLSQPIIYKEFKPHPKLRHFIKCFWLLEREYDDLQPTENVFPDSYVEVIFNFGEKYYIEKSGIRVNLPAAFMIGLLKQVFPLHAAGKVSLIAARFYPWEIFTFFDMPVKSNINTNFNFVISREPEQEIRDCFRRNKHETAVRVLEKLFLEIYVQKHFDRDTVNAAAQIIYQKKGDCKIEDLADFLPTTLRTLERNFRRQVGVSPKSYSNNVRFDKIRRKIYDSPDLNLTDLAYEFGYFDQAHFIKDFKSFCGKTPSAFARQIRNLRKVFTVSENVVFLQSDDAVG